MRAAVLYEARTPMTIEQVSVDGPKDDEVLVEVRATGACHSDYHVIDGSWNGASYPFPMILGHEAAGVVDKVGADVNTVKRGDHVILSFAPNCGRCRMCTIGQPHLLTSTRDLPQPEISRRAPPTTIRRTRRGQATGRTVSAARQQYQAAAERYGR